eukprot:435767-Lingulodinium_polyedra.AAC.1
MPMFELCGGVGVCRAESAWRHVSLAASMLTFLHASGVAAVHFTPVSAISLFGRRTPTCVATRSQNWEVQQGCPAAQNARGAASKCIKLRNSHQYWTPIYAPFVLDTRHVISGCRR